MREDGWDALGQQVHNSVGASGNGSNSTLTNDDQFSEWQGITTQSRLPLRSVLIRPHAGML